MDFSSSAFRAPVPSTKVSDDTMSHTNMVMACRWGWTSSDTNTDAQMAASRSTSTHVPVSTFNNVRTKRFAPCQGRLYHQLSCSHRIRTDLVEDCGANCVEPFGTEIGLPFMCNECFQDEATKIWEDRKTRHNASWPPMDQMSPVQRDQWCFEYRQLEDEYARDRKIYELELKGKTRPSNICSVLEASKEEMDFATELDSLSLSLTVSNEDSLPSLQGHLANRPRLSLPNDASEQLHWNLNTLALDRGSCGVEYAPPSANNRAPSLRQPAEDDLWGRQRERN